jgi:hypothetical protein
MKVIDLYEVLSKLPSCFEVVIEIGGEYVEVDEDSIKIIDEEDMVRLMEIG